MIEIRRIVETQRRDPNSLLDWLEQAIRMRRECPEISWGDWRVLDAGARDVLAMRYDHDGHTLVAMHNFSARPRAVGMPAGALGDPLLVNLLTMEDSRADDGGRHQIELEAHGYRWFRAGGLDRNVARG